MILESTEDAIGCELIMDAVVVVVKDEKKQKTRDLRVRENKMQKEKGFCVCRGPG